MAWTGGPEAFGCIELPRFTGPIKKKIKVITFTKNPHIQSQTLRACKEYMNKKKAHMQSQTLRTYKGQWVM